MPRLGQKFSTEFARHDLWRFFLFGVNLFEKKKIVNTVIFSPKFDHIVKHVVPEL